MPITVIVAEDMEVMRRAIRRLLEFEPEITVVGEAADFAQAIRLTEEIKPRIVVMDMHMPNETGLTAAEIRSGFKSHGPRLLAVSIWDDAETKSRATSFGAVMLLDKAKLGTDLIPAIKLLATA